MRVTFNIPKEAALRLKQLAERGDDTLKELGILSVQVEGDQVCVPFSSLEPFKVPTLLVDFR